MITKIQLGEKSLDVLEIQFGTGDIMMHKSNVDNVKALLFCELAGRKVGETTDEFMGMSVDELPCEIRCAFTFKNPESITALIHSLIELQKEVFDVQKNP